MSYAIRQAHDKAVYQDIEIINVTFETVREEFQSLAEIFGRVKRLQRSETSESNLADFVIERPAEVLEVRIVKEMRRIFLHPFAQLDHANATNVLDEGNGMNE